MKPRRTRPPHNLLKKVANSKATTIRYLALSFRQQKSLAFQNEGVYTLRRYGGSDAPQNAENVRQFCVHDDCHFLDDRSASDPTIDLVVSVSPALYLNHGNQVQSVRYWNNLWNLTTAVPAKTPRSWPRTCTLPCANATTKTNPKLWLCRRIPW